MSQGFTLIELAIVLIIIGLLAGGVLVGRDLVYAAALRGQVTQINQYDTAVSAFRLRYGGLPGDISSAEDFGFTPRSGAEGHGDEDGVVELCNYFPAWSGSGCEIALFWSDLSQAHLIGDGLTAATDGDIAITDFADSLRYYPRAKISEAATIVSLVDNHGANWFGIYRIGFAGLGANWSSPLSALSAFTIDSKMDDGLPATGRAVAVWGVGVAELSWFSAAPGCTDLTGSRYDLDAEDDAGCPLNIRMIMGGPR